MIDRAKIDQIKAEKSRLIAALTDAGARFVADNVSCPFHDDQHPSGGIHEHNRSGWLYTCHGCTWNRGKNSGDVFDVTRKVHGCDFTHACELLGLGNGKAPAPFEDRTPAVQDARKGGGLADSTLQFAGDAHARLLRDSGALLHLSTTRGIDQATAELLGIGLTGKPGQRFWTLPIVGKCEQVVAIKAHRADGQSVKSWWSPKGASRSHVWPVDLTRGCPVWLCPGELKAAAVIACGRSAIGITSGEGSRSNPADLPAAAMEKLRGLAVAIAPDDDEVGRAWGEHVRQQLADAGIGARIIKLPLDRVVRLKDVGDLIVQMYQNGKDRAAVAASLDKHYRRSDPLYEAMIGELWNNGIIWTPDIYVPTGLRALDMATGGGLRTHGVTMLVGRTNQAKSQLAVAIAANAAKAGKPVGFFSLELGANEVAHLVAAQLGDIPRRALATGELQVDFGDRLRKVTTEYRDMPLCILDDKRWPGGLTLSTLDALIADGVTRFGWRIVFLDYLGLLVSSGQDQFQADIQNSTALRELARRHEVALVVIAALRKGQGANTAEPIKVSIDDVAGAGRLAYDAQNVLLVWCDHGNGASGIVHVRPLKMRYAPMMDDPNLQFRWQPRTGLITDLEGNA